MADRPLVIVTRKLPDVVETRLRELFDARLNLEDKPFTREELIDAVKIANVLVPTVTDRIDRAVLSQASPDLKLIAQFGTGVDNIDLETARNRSILVTNTPGVLTEDTADMTMALILAVPRRLTEGATMLKQRRQWLAGLVADLDARPPHLRQAARHRRHGARSARPWPSGPRRSACRSTITTGRRVAPEVEKALEATYWDSLDQMIARMDIISVNCPHTPATYHLLSARRLALLKPSAYIVNTARGEVIDENALARMIENNELAGAGLDVFEHEPAVNPKLLKSSKVVVLPHMGSATLEGRVDMGEKVIINIKTFLDGHAPPDRVHPAMF